MINVARDATIKDEGQGVYFSDLSIHDAPPPEIVRSKREFAGKMVGLGFAGDMLAVYGGLLLAFWVRFDTPVRAFGRRASFPMTTAQYHGHFLFLGVTLMLILFRFGLYSSGRPLPLRRVNAILLTSCILWVSRQPRVELRVEHAAHHQPRFPSVRLRLHAGDADRLALAVATIFLSAPHCRTAPAAHSLRGLERTGTPDGQPHQRRPPAPLPDHRLRAVARWRLRPGSGRKRQGRRSLRRSEIPAHRLRIDLVLVASVDPTEGGLFDLVNCCEKEMVHLQIVPSGFQVFLSGLHVETTAGVPVLGISRLPLDSFWNGFVKRTLDVVGAVVGLILSAPLIAVFASWSTANRPGQSSIARRVWDATGKHFDILKIRTMHLNAEAGGGVGWSRKEDPRRLRIGSLMRSHNIDEVPQFWNVLKGEMSLVGPRPERPELIQTFKEEIPHYNARHSIKPGITGWAQVNGFRGDTDLVERIKCDLFYIENWSP